LSNRTFVRYAKPALGFLLLAAIFFQLDFTRISTILTSISLSWLSTALVLSVSANIICALRWHKIICIYGAPYSVRQALDSYFQGVAINTVLPGGIVSGDIWRSLGLISKGVSKFTATHIVLLDRAAGFWALCVISLIALVFLEFSAELFGSEIAPDLPSGWIVVYVSGLAAATIIPFVLGLVGFVKAALTVWRTIGHSLLAQFATILAFYCCLRAVNVDLGWFPTAAVCAGIFLAAAVPVSIGGFGSREVAAVFFLAALGLGKEPCVIASILFGLTATLQGFLVLLFGFNAAPWSEKLNPTRYLRGSSGSRH